MLSSMGVEVVDERPYELDGLRRPSHIYDFGLRYAAADPRRGRRAVPGRVRGGLGRASEIDGFNALVLRPG